MAVPVVVAVAIRMRMLLMIMLMRLMMLFVLRVITVLAVLESGATRPATSGCKSEQRARGLQHGYAQGCTRDTL